MRLIDADKYCVVHKNQELYAKEIECYNSIDWMNK